MKSASFGSLKKQRQERVHVRFRSPSYHSRVKFRLFRKTIDLPHVGGKADVFIVTCDLFTTGADHLQAGHIDVLMLLFFFVVLHHFARHGDFMVQVVGHLDVLASQSICLPISILDGILPCLVTLFEASRDHDGFSRILVRVRGFMPLGSKRHTAAQAQAQESNKKTIQDSRFHSLLSHVALPSDAHNRSCI